MAVTTRYSLDEFIHDMTDLVAGAPDQSTLFDRGSSLIARLVRDPESVPEQYRRPSVGGRRPGGGSYLLHRGPGLSITSVVWGPGSHAGPHDHHTWGMIGVMGNAIQETRFRRVDDRSREGYARLEKDRAVLVRPGEVSLLIPDEDEIPPARQLQRPAHRGSPRLRPGSRRPRALPLRPRIRQGLVVRAGPVRQLLMMGCSGRPPCPPRSRRGAGGWP